jgi:two-component system response regulator FlrC
MAVSQVLVVEDDQALQEAIVDTLELAGCEVIAASSGEQAMQLLAANTMDMVITDVNMGGMDGHELLANIKQQQPFLPVLLITAYGSIQRSVSAMRNGAVDYLVKPFEPKVLIDLVRQHALGRCVQASDPVAVAPASRNMLQLAQRVAATDSTVLLSGESGTGKEVIARYIHRHSTRKDAPFIAINCAAIPETMLEATLFGHEKGAFTGALQSAPGKFEQANGGTLLLDEISEMDLALQVKLLRVLQEQEVERVGGRKVIPLDVRIIATTNRDLQHYVSQGEFREDLYYRLSVFPLHLLPLRERVEDIVPLAKRLLAEQAKKMQRPMLNFSQAAEQALESIKWPGNVRELGNVIQRALILQSGNTLDASDLMFDGVGPVVTMQSAEAKSARTEQSLGEQSLGNDLKQHEFQIIVDALEASKGSRKEAAQRLGVSPRTLRYKMAKMRELQLID